MDPDLQVLRRLVGDHESFAERSWAKSPLLRRAADDFSDLLDLDAVDHLLTSTARRPTFRLVRDGETIPEQEVTTTVRLGGATVDDAADVGRIGELIADGATLVLQGLQRTWPPITDLCRALERATSHTVQANAYLTPAGAAGLGAHADGHDVIVVQTVGSKAWEVAGLGEIVLEAGDVLYLPTGTTHAAAAQAGPSLHLTVGLLRDTWRAIVQRALADVKELDAPLPLGYARADGSEALEQGVRAALQSAAEHLEKADAAAAAAGATDRARRRRRPLLRGHVASVLTLVDDDTVVRRRPDAPVSVEDAGDDGLDLVLVDRTVHLPAHASAPAQMLADGQTVRVGDLPGLDAAGRATLTRRLVREGLLEVVDT